MHPIITNNLKGKEKSKDKVFIKNKDGEVFDYEGSHINKDVIDSVASMMLCNQRGFSKSMSLESPFDDLKVPVYLEHTPEVVGWCNLGINKRGSLSIDPMKVTCNKTWARIKSGDLKGFSMGSLVGDTRCNICGYNYVECNHIAGNFYLGQKCYCELKEIDLAEVSIVKNPAHPLATISRYE